MTKTQRKAEFKKEWNDAIREGRLVRFSTGCFRTYATPGAALMAMNIAIKDGIDANIVPAELAQ